MRKQNFIAKAQFHWLRRLMQGKSGQAVVETALLLPVFFLLFVGTIQYAITLFTYCNATYACRNAARYASVRSTSSISPASVAQVQSLVTSGLFLNTAIAPTVAVAYYTPALAIGSNTVGDIVTVSASWNQTIVIPFMSNQSVSVGTQASSMITR